MNDLERYFASNTDRLIHKWIHYFEIYDRHFSRFRNTDVHILEIGVSHGGSLQMWRDYFGPQAKIIGVDIDPRCKDLGGEGIEILIGSQEDREFLASIREQYPRIDILIDDGGHTMAQQIITFDELFFHIAADGVYLCEDLHTSYWNSYGGGYRRRNSFIEYSKDWIDDLNAWHSHDPESFPITHFTQSAHSMHYYDSVLVIEKRVMAPPEVQMTGKPSFDEEWLQYFMSQFSGQDVAPENPESKRPVPSGTVPEGSITEGSVREGSDLTGSTQDQELAQQLEQVQTNLQQIQQEQTQAQLQLQDTQAQLQETQVALTASQSTVAAMESSKFWKLRSQWLSIKSKLGLST
jgi:hypothetical protein